MRTSTSVCFEDRHEQILLYHHKDNGAALRVFHCGNRCADAGRLRSVGKSARVEIFRGESYATLRGNALCKSARDVDYEASEAGRGAD
jgi:hypothetical protein